MAMASDSACAKLISKRFLLPSRFNLPSPPPAAACKSRIRLTTTTRIKIKKPRPLAAVLPEPSSFAVNNNYEEVHVSAPAIDLALRVYKPAATFMLFASYCFQSVRPLLFVSFIFLVSVPVLSFVIPVIERIHEFTSSVIKLQVGISGSGSSRIQMNLTHTAKVADASGLGSHCVLAGDASGLGSHCVLAETALNLLQNIDFCYSVYSSVDVKLNFDEWETRFKLLSVEEQCKFDEDALVNMNSIWTSNTRATEFRDKNIVVTILIAVKGVHKLSPINGTSYLREALQKIASIPAENTLAVEVFWTPQNEKDMQWEQKLLKDFPLLRAL